MFLRVILAFLLLPGMAAGVFPLILFFVDPFKIRGNLFGILIIGVGLLVLCMCVRDFYVSGKGTLAPWSPAVSLVVVGLYRYVRNPMYLGVLTILLGWIVVTGSLLVFGYTLILASGFHIRVKLSEEPWAEKTFGGEWHEYKNNVSRWLPRFKGYDPK